METSPLLVLAETVDSVPAARKKQRNKEALKTLTAFYSPLDVGLVDVRRA